MSKSCIILSQGPVPTPEHKTVEGGGLRCWGLAMGVKANGTDAEVTVAYNDSYRKEGFTADFNGIRIRTWNMDSVAELIAEYDTVIVSYCMGDLSVKVADAIRPDQQLVLDCYVPIYVEVSARQSDDLIGEYKAFHNDVGRWAHVLRRGDLFLCSSEAQKKYYKGVLSAIGRVNPITYSDELLLVVPYGIYREKPHAKTKPISKLVGSEYKKILWFGGIYPWFDLRTLVDAVDKVNASVPSKLIIVGAKNPFNNHPDFVRRYTELVEYIDSNPAFKDMVVMQDWVSFDDRADWYLDSDLVVVINKEGEENSLAWRTRLVDFMWADLPIITNGGDPLGELLIENRAAARIDSMEASNLAANIVDALSGGAELKIMRKNLGSLKERFYWDVATSELTGHIVKHKRAADLMRFGSMDIIQPAVSVQGKMRKIAYKIRSIPAYQRKYGTRSTVHALRTTAGNQAAKVSRKLGYENGTSQKVVFIAHQLDMSGAPFVFMDMVRAFKQSAPTVPMEFHTFNPAHEINIRDLNGMGIKPKLHISRDIEIPFTQGDVAVVNTVGISRTLKEGIYRSLESGRLKKLFWYVHEDEPELLFEKDERARLKTLMAEKKVVIYTAAKQTVDHYREFFGDSDNVLLQPYKFIVEDRFHKVRKAADFDKLSFILPGTVSDGRKGQMPVFYAFKAFYDHYYRSDPSKYRDFELVYVGMSDDFLSRQLIRHADGLGSRFKYHEKVTHERSSELIMESNMTICYSIRECLPLFVFEGMAAGHPILRNECSGVDEQLEEGRNGYRLDTHDYGLLVETLEKVMNRTTTSNEDLAKMSSASHDIALRQRDHSYDSMVKSIAESFGA